MEHLERTRKELLESVQGLTEEQLHLRPAEDSWTIAQVLHHLYLTERSISRVIEKALNQESSLPVPPKPVQFVLDRSRKISAPDFLKPSDEPIKREQLEALLEESHNKILQAYHQIKDPADFTQKSFPHRIIGELNLEQWFEFTWMHEQRHIEQIKEIIKQIS